MKAVRKIWGQSFLCTMCITNTKSESEEISLKMIDFLSVEKKSYPHVKNLILKISHSNKSKIVIRKS